MATKKPTKKKKSPAPKKKAAPKKAAPKKAAPKKAALKKAKAAKAAKKASTTKAPAKAKAASAPATKASTKKKAAPVVSAVVESVVAVAKKASAVVESVVAVAKAVVAPKKPSGPVDPSVELAQAIAALVLDKKGEDVVILQVTDLTSYADCFVLASAPSERQVQAIARNVDEEMKRAGKAPVGTEGLEQGHWVLVDLGSAVLHVFLSSARQYYDLEGFWADAPRVDVDEAFGKEIVAKMTAARAAREQAAEAEADAADRAAAANE